MMDVDSVLSDVSVPNPNNQRKPNKRLRNVKSLSDRRRQWNLVSRQPLISFDCISEALKPALPSVPIESMTVADNKENNCHLSNQSSIVESDTNECTDANQCFSIMRILESQSNTVFDPIVDPKHKIKPLKKSKHTQIRKRKRNPRKLANSERSIYGNLLISQSTFVEFEDIIALQFRAYLNVNDITMDELSKQLSVEPYILTQLFSVNQTQQIDSEIFDNIAFQTNIIEWMRKNRMNIPDCVLSAFNIEIYPKNCSEISDSDLIQWLKKHVNTLQLWDAHTLGAEMNMERSRLKKIVSANGCEMYDGEREKIISWIEWRQRLLDMGGFYNFIESQQSELSAPQQSAVAQQSSEDRPKDEAWLQSIVEGSMVYCVDAGDDKWQSYVLRRLDNDVVLIHYKNFSRIYDEWIHLSDDRITPLQSNINYAYGEDNIKMLKECMRDLLQIASVTVDDIVTSCKWKKTACQNWLDGCSVAPKTKRKKLGHFVREISALHGLSLDAEEDVHERAAALEKAEREAEKKNNPENIQVPVSVSTDDTIAIAPVTTDV